MPDRTILVMRHAERPVPDDPDDPHLSKAGRKRAEHLVDWVPKEFGDPDFIIATAPSKHSVRPIETVKPLAKKLDLKIDDDFEDQAYGILAHKLLKKKRFEGKIALVCWHHGNIPNLMHALGCADGSYPDPWPRDAFNIVLVATIAEDGTPAVRQVAEPF